MPAGIVISKIHSPCAECGGAIKPGDQIAVDCPGEGAVHLRCSRLHHYPQPCYRCGKWLPDTGEKTGCEQDCGPSFPDNTEGYHEHVICRDSEGCEERARQEIEAEKKYRREHPKRPSEEW